MVLNSTQNDGGVVIRGHDDSVDDEGSIGRYEGSQSSIAPLAHNLAVAVIEKEIKLMQLLPVLPRALTCSELKCERSAWPQSPGELADHGGWIFGMVECIATEREVERVGGDVTIEALGICIDCTIDTDRGQSIQAVMCQDEFVDIE